jgi:hypothetical protein
MLEGKESRGLQIILERQLPQFGGGLGRDLPGLAVALTVATLVFAARVPQCDGAAVPLLILGGTISRLGLVRLDGTDEYLVAQTGEAQGFLLLLFANPRRNEGGVAFVLANAFRGASEKSIRGATRSRNGGVIAGDRGGRL